MKPLNDNQMSVLIATSDGLCVKRAARALGMNINAVKDRRKEMMACLGAKTMPHAISIAYQIGLLKITP